MVLSYKTGAAGSAAGAMAEYLTGSKDVPEMAARLASYLGDAYALNVAAGTAALPMLDMHPLIADLLAIDTTRSLSKEEVTNLLAGNTSRGDPIPGREIQESTKDKTRLGFTDFTFSAPKSLSISIALSHNERERIVLETAFMRANNDLMKHIEQEIGGVRQGRGGRLGVIPGHMAVIQFHHATARPTKQTAQGQDTELSQGKPEDLRPGDMQRHIHNVFLHATISDDGDVKAPDLRETKGRILEWGALGHAYLVSHLRAAGVRAEQDPKTGLSYLPAIPEAMVELFSARTRLGEAMAKARAASEGQDFDSLSRQDQERYKHSEVKRGRQAKEDLSEQEFWQKTAAEAGYVHQSVINPDNRQSLVPEAERARIAYEAAIDLLEPELAKRSKLDAATIRTMTARGFITAGIERADEIETVISAFMTEGVKQDGQIVQMIAGREKDERFASATTALHVDQERQAIGILKAAAADKTAALTYDQIEAAIRRVAAKKGYDFSSEHGLKQRALSHSLAMGGRAVAAIGAAGVGKTTLLEAVVDAYHEAGWTSYGATLGWRQTAGLIDAGVGQKKQSRPVPDTSALINAGIAKDHAHAMAPFLKAIETGTIKLDAKSIVFIDELSQVDTQQILALAKAQQTYNFKIAAVGDEAQCGAIAAGNSIRLFRLGLGADQIPELLDSIRQRRLEDRETAKLLRIGKPEQTLQALERKEDAGLLALIPGDYHDTIKAGVDWLEQRQADQRENYSVGVSLPSNADVHAFGLEYRARQRNAGKLGTDWVIEATDQNGVQTDMAIAVGDHVRLYNRVNASFLHGKHGRFGNNGTVAEIVSIDKRYGLRLKRDDGVVGAIKWKTLQDKATGRIRLGYGTSLTIDARQSATLTDHLTLLPEGSRTIDRNKAYSAGTRGREDDMLIVSHGAEKEAVRNRRPMGDPWLAQASEGEMRQAIMENMARNLSRVTEKGLAVEFLDRGLDLNYGGVNTQQAAWFKSKVQTPQPPSEQEAASVAAIQRVIAHSPIKLLTGPEQRERTVKRARQHRTPTNATVEFADALRQRGLKLKGQPVMDGQWHRAQVEGDRGKAMSGRYRGYTDGLPAGFVQNFKTGVAEPWRSDRPMPAMTEADLRQREADRVARANERQSAEDAAAKRAFAVWSNAKPVTQHDYLIRKDVAAHDIRVNVHGQLVVPMKDAAGWVRNVQTINPDGEKRFVAGGRKTGLYAQLGAIDPKQPILIAEGYATAATLREATGLPVIVAFDAGNLHAVARTIRDKYPTSQIIFAADNDHHLPRKDIPLPNVGKEKAEAAAAGFNGIVIAPSFGALERQPVMEKSPPTDWNDYAAINGPMKLQAVIADQLKSKGVIMPEKKPEYTPLYTQAERDAARAASTATPPNQAQQDAMRQQQKQQQNHRQVER